MAKRPGPKSTGPEQTAHDAPGSAEVISLLVKREKTASKAETKVVKCKKALKDAQEEYAQAVNGIREIIQEQYQPNLFPPDEADAGGS